MCCSSLKIQLYQQTIENYCKAFKKWCTSVYFTSLFKWEKLSPFYTFKSHMWTPVVVFCICINLEPCPLSHWKPSPKANVYTHTYLKTDGWSPDFVWMFSAFLHTSSSVPQLKSTAQVHLRASHACDKWLYLKLSFIRTSWNGTYAIVIALFIKDLCFKNAIFSEM